MPIAAVYYALVHLTNVTVGATTPPQLAVATFGNKEVCERLKPDFERITDLPLACVGVPVGTTLPWFQGCWKLGTDPNGACVDYQWSGTYYRPKQ